MKKPKRLSYPNGIYGDIDYERALEKYCSHLEKKLSKDAKIMENKAEEYLKSYHDNNPKDWLFEKRKVVAKLITDFASREVALAICPDLEREKEEFAVGFAEWIINDFDVVNFGFATEPTFRKKGAGTFDKLYLSSQLLELYKNRDNGK